AGRVNRRSKLSVLSSPETRDACAGLVQHLGQRGEVMPIRLAVVDGQPLLRYGLRELIARHADIEIVAECQSAGGTLAIVAVARPDVVTVDVALPDGDGLMLAREVRDSYQGLG